MVQMLNPNLCLVNLYFHWSKSDWMCWILTLKVETFIVLRVIPCSIFEDYPIPSRFTSPGFFLGMLASQFHPCPLTSHTRRPAMQAWRDAETLMSSGSRNPVPRMFETCWNPIDNPWINHWWTGAGFLESHRMVKKCQESLLLKRKCSFFRWSPHFD